MAEHTRAIEIIGRSCLGDFHSALDWAQWCRDVAWAARDGDGELLETLASYVISKATGGPNG